MLIEPAPFMSIPESALVVSRHTSGQGDQPRIWTPLFALIAACASAC